MSDEIVYKVLTASELAALETGDFLGSAVDLADGFVHFSTAAQLTETVRRHFAGQSDLRLAAVAVHGFGGALRWEASRGGELFPHLYGRLALADVITYGPLRREPDGSVRLPLDPPTVRAPASTE